MAEFGRFRQTRGARRAVGETVKVGVLIEPGFEAGLRRVWLVFCGLLGGPFWSRWLGWVEQRGGESGGLLNGGQLVA